MKKHIRLLEEANLVATEEIGRARRCTPVPYAFEGIEPPSRFVQTFGNHLQTLEFEELGERTS